MNTPGRVTAAVLSAFAAAGSLAACGSGDADGETLTVYCAQNESMVRTML